MLVVHDSSEQEEVDFLLPLPCSCALETDVKIEREWRYSLQRSTDQEKQNVSQLNSELAVLRTTKEVQRVLID